MSTDARLIFLIAKAGSLAGSEYKLAKALGVDQQTISAWKSGRRNCTPPDRARLAAAAQEDANQELVRSTIAQASGVRKEQLIRVLGKALRQTGEALHSVALVAVSLTFGTTMLDIPRCIKSSK